MKRNNLLIDTAIFFLSVAVVSYLGCGGSGGKGGGVSLTSTDALRLSADTSAMHEYQQAVFNDAGTGLAVWQAYNGSRYRILYSVYSGGIWSKEAELAKNAQFPVAATNGDNFMAAYVKGYILYAISFDGASWGTETEMQTDYYASSTSQLHVIASNGTGYALVWRKNEASGQNIYANISAGGTSWGAAELVKTGSGIPYYIGIASDGAGYAVAWTHGSDIYANIYDNDDSKWGTVDTIDTGNDTAAGPSIASNGTGYAVAWYQYDGSNRNIYAKLYLGTFWGTVAAIQSGTASASYPSIASDGTFYAVTWMRSGNIYASVNNGVWGTSEIIESASESASSPVIASNGTGYAVAWRQYDGSVYNMHANLYNGAVWSGEEEVDSGNESVGYYHRITNRGANYAVIWNQVDGKGNSNVFTAIHGGTDWEQVSLISGLYKGSAERQKVAVNSAGKILAVWQQYNNGSYYVYGKVNSKGTWGMPFIIAENALYPDAASNGTNFMITYVKNSEICAISFDGQYWQTEALIGSASYYSGEYSFPAIASNGKGYAVVWYERPGGDDNIYANIYGENCLWGTAIIISGAGAYYPAVIASNGNGYAVVWKQDDGSDSIYANICDGAYTWAGAVNIDSGSGNAGSPSVASNGTGYAAAWHQEDGGINSVYANVYAGTLWGTAGKIESGSGEALSPFIASNGAGYAAAWTRNDGSADSIYANFYNGSAWGTEAVIESANEKACSFSIASNGAGYAAVWTQNDGTADSIYAGIYDGTSWGEPILLDNNDRPAQAPFIISNGNRYSAAWQQVDEDDELAIVIWAKLYFIEE